MLDKLFCTVVLLPIVTEGSSMKVTKWAQFTKKPKNIIILLCRHIVAGNQVVYVDCP